MQLNISGYSTALFATWYFIDEWGLLFDAGDGFVAALLQKSRKVNHVFISHADRDHLTGLLQFNQLNARPGFPVIHYPKDSSSIPAMEAFSKAFDPHVSRTVWTPLVPGEKVMVKDNLYVEALQNGHVAVKKGVAKSLSFKVYETKRKLKPEWSHLSGEQIGKLSQQVGKDNITYEVRTDMLGYSGDTPVEDVQRWNNCGILIHEATFLGGSESIPQRTHGNKHSTLDEVMDMVSSIQIQQLVLGHFSSRYSPEQIDKSILNCCDKYGISIPVHRILPGQFIEDILRQPPVNQ